MLDALIIEPHVGPQVGTVIWMHGLGANGYDFEPIVPTLGLPNARFVFPHAPEIPVTLNMGWVMPAWYDIKTLEDVPNREDTNGVLASAARIEELIGAEVERGVPSNRIVVAGFSQGGAMALYVGLRHASELAGIMVLSGALLLPDRLGTEAAEANRQTPILICHGELDDLVPLGRGERARDALAELTPDRQLEWHSFRMGHEVCPQEIEVIGAWLRARLNP